MTDRSQIDEWKQPTSGDPKANAILEAIKLRQARPSMETPKPTDSPGHPAPPTLDPHDQIKDIIAYRDMAARVGILLVSKRRAYGGSFKDAGAVLKLLYPDGVQPDQYGDMLCVVRILDKLFRIATDNDPDGEDPYKDIAGYGVLGAVNRARSNPTVPETP